MARILVVGAGMAGAVYARQLAEAGHTILVIDSRPHIAGNCYDYVDENGVRVHKYGPHLFHTSNRTVVDWLSRFTEWVPYTHEVVAALPSGDLAPMPINLDTVNTVFGKSFESAEEVDAFLASVSENVAEIKTAEDHLFSVIGRELTDLFFRPYTKKMWGFDLSEMDASVVQRLKIRTDRDKRYFPSDSFQAMPKDGYTALFEAAFDHGNIDVLLSQAFDQSMLGDFEYCFNSMPIDEYFSDEFGPLPYRSIRFDLTAVPRAEAQPHVVINYTHDGPKTRETWWHNLPAHDAQTSDLVTRTVEEPCDYQDNNFERYYPVKTADNRFQDIYKKYRDLAEAETNISFIGRCGTYQYLDMHQVVNQSLMGAEKWLGEH